VSLVLLLPLGLAALAALALPLLLHLHRRQEQQRTVFAALRWIRGPARPRRRLRLEQWPLLLLRMLLLALIALLLARPAWQADATAQDWVLVVPGVDAARAQARLDAPAAQWRWLRAGFPLFDAAKSTDDTVEDVASLLREFDAGLPAGSRLQVIVPGTLRGLDGGEIRLSRAVDWLVVDQAPGPPVAAAAAPRRVSLRMTDAAPGAAYLRAALEALNGEGEPRFVLADEAPDAALDAGTALVFWLGTAPSPALLAWVRDGGTALLDSGRPADAEVLARDAQGAPLLLQQREGLGRLLRFTAGLDPAILPLLQDGSFPQVLSAALLPPAPPPGVATAAALQPLQGAATITRPPQALDSPLLILIALLALAERGLSWRSSRRSA
jgi:Aerotolerance regulator N-terminal